MVTNTKEYMRQYQAKRRALLKSKEIVKNVKIEMSVEELLKVAADDKRFFIRAIKKCDDIYTITLELEN